MENLLKQIYPIQRALANFLCSDIDGDGYPDILQATGGIIQNSGPGKTGH